MIGGWRTKMWWGNDRGLATGRNSVVLQKAVSDSQAARSLLRYIFPKIWPPHKYSGGAERLKASGCLTLRVWRLRTHVSRDLGHSTLGRYQCAKDELGMTRDQSLLISAEKAVILLPPMRSHQNYCRWLHTHKDSPCMHKLLDVG